MYLLIDMEKIDIQVLVTISYINTTGEQTHLCRANFPVGWGFKVKVFDQNEAVLFEVHISYQSDQLANVENNNYYITIAPLLEEGSFRAAIQIVGPTPHSAFVSPRNYGQDLLIRLLDDQEREEAGVEEEIEEEREEEEEEFNVFPTPPPTPPL
ncbi:Hypothetical protein CINCED_3A023198 [Cinara cedri]|uniref:Uncharacterized protein n=1 Tax=Cinara cedri TaxID=506608 RepID=A0A5E4MKW9_9HEMI|nr:Hypothetical protein CINCED_3A023198 [Cinara cedri]